MSFRVKPSAVGSVIVLQPTVRVHRFVFVGVWKGSGGYPDIICLWRWCLSVFIPDLCACLCFLCACLQVYVTFHLSANISSLWCVKQQCYCICCPARFYLPFSCLRRANGRSPLLWRPCRKPFVIVVVCGDERLRLYIHGHLSSLNISAIFSWEFYLPYI